MSFNGCVSSKIYCLSGASLNFIAFLPTFLVMQKVGAQPA